MSQPSNTEAEVAEAIFTMYMKDGQDHTVDEIASHMGWPSSRVRRALGAGGAAMQGIRSEQISRVSYSRDYKSFESGYHRVWVYGPTRDMLRQKMVAARG